DTGSVQDSGGDRDTSVAQDASNDQDAGNEQDSGTNATCATPNATMTFFVTDHGNYPNGGNLGGLAGADERCRQAAEAAGIVGKTWVAYLSTSTINARDRIGNGPWYNHAGTNIGDLASIHPDNGTTGLAFANILTECGRRISNDENQPTELTRHDI